MTLCLRATNPFPFMEMISVEGKTNFFEKRVGEYAAKATKQQGDDAFDIFALISR